MKINAVVKSMRIEQWIKNLFIFAPLIFSQKAQQPLLLLKTFAAFFIFCILSGSLYIFNDIKDSEEDNMHPEKSKRPIASGEIGKDSAFFIFIILCISSLMIAFFIDKYFFLAALVFCVIQLAYSIKLKHIIIIDVFIITAGFVIRVFAGGVVINVPISSWLLICTMFLALFLALGKRRYELLLLGNRASGHRPILKKYSSYFVDQMIAVVTSSLLIAYCLYTISGKTIEKLSTSNLVFSIPLVLYGIFRYLYLIHQKEKGGSPEEMIIRDIPFLVNILLWIVTIIFILYLI